MFLSFSRLCYLFLWSALSVSLICMMGFFFFIGYVSLLRPPLPPFEKTDALVVLTGGRGRVITGFSLLNQDASSNLFISGVKKNVREADILSEVLKKEAFFIPFSSDFSKVQLGHRASNTHENAEEVALWIHQKNIRNKEALTIKSIRLVTSVYHMPRSLLEFKKALPTIKVIPHPVFSSSFSSSNWQRSLMALKLLLSEYLKYIVAFSRMTLEKAVHTVAFNSEGNLLYYTSLPLKNEVFTNLSLCR